MNEEDSPAGTATAEIDVVDIADEEEGGSDQHSNPKVNMAHGFVRSIQRNQVTRGLCDQDEDAMRMAIRVGRSVKASTTRTSAASPTGAATAKARRREQQLWAFWMFDLFLILCYSRLVSRQHVFLNLSYLVYQSWNSDALVLEK